MTQNERQLELTRAVDAFPAWMEEGQSAKQLLGHSAERGFPAFVRVRARSVVVEQQLFAPMPTSFASASRMGPLPLSYAQQKEKMRGGDLIDRPIERPRIRFLELEAGDLQNMATSGQISRHWFRRQAIESGEAGVLIRPAALRCIRPALTADSESNPMASRLLSAIVFDAEQEYTFGVDDVFIWSSDASVLKHESFKPDVDPHHLFESAPAVFGLYAAAKKFAAELTALPRGRAPIDKARMDELKARVFKHFDSFGKPYKSIAVKDQAFKFVDPKYPWGKGASRRGSFEEAASAVENFYEKYAYENFVDDGLGLIIHITRLAIAERFKIRTSGKGEAALQPGVVHRQLVKHNFSGVHEIEAIASIILWQGPKAPRKTPSEKKPLPCSRSRR